MIRVPAFRCDLQAGCSPCHERLSKFTQVAGSHLLVADCHSTWPHAPSCVYAQVVLTGEPALVSMAAALLEAMMEHNSAGIATLYQTGVFFFALAYCGSNLVEIGRLFKVLPRLIV